VSYVVRLNIMKSHLNGFGIKRLACLKVCEEDERQDARYVNLFLRRLFPKSALFAVLHMVKTISVLVLTFMKFLFAFWTV